MAKQTFKYQELYIASTEKSAITGNAGFGVRAATEGMSPSDAQFLSSFFSTGYSVDMDHTLTRAKILENPEVSYEYTPTFEMRECEFPDGRKAYVVARTVYIGIDYGFFTDDNGAQRVGANYFTHLFVFDEKPPISVIETLCDECLFMPQNYVLRPDNQELRTLLTGEPPVLAAGKEIIIDSVSTNPMPFIPEMALVVQGLLQMHKNSTKPDALKQMMVRAKNDVVPQLIFEMGRLPKKLTQGLSFQTNYMNQGMPLDFNLVFVNEYNDRDLYEDYVIFANTTDGSKRNIEDNSLMRKIAEFIAAGDQQNTEKLIDYVLSLDPEKDTDYDFLYKVFIAIESDLPLMLDDITPDFLQKVSNMKLDPVKLRNFWEDINDAINNGLQSGSSGSGRDIVKGIAVAGYVDKISPAKLAIDPESKAQITALLFGRNSYLDKLLTPANCDLVIKMIDKSQINSPELFFAGLHKSASVQVWEKLIREYYGSGLDANFAFVVDNVVTSPLTADERISLLRNLYPVQTHENDYLSYIFDRPGCIGALGSIVGDVCSRHKEDIFFDIVQRSNYNRSVIESLAPTFISYFERQLDARTDATMRRLLAFIDKIGSENAAMLGAGKVVRAYMEGVYKTPPRESNQILDSLIASGMKLDQETTAMVNRSKCLLDQRVPKTVTPDFIHSAHRMRLSPEYIQQLFKIWLTATKPDKRAMKELLAGLPNLSSAIIEGFVTDTWANKNIANNGDLVLAIVDNTEWPTRKAFLKQCKDADLVKFLGDSDKFFTKLARKLFK